VDGRSRTHQTALSRKLCSPNYPIAAARCCVYNKSEKIGSTNHTKV
jgi:hypothetical protein